MLAFNRIRALLIGGAGLITLYFTFQLSKELLAYFPLKEAAPAKISQWEIEEIDGRYALKGVYTFEAQGKTWKGTSRLHPPYFWNEPAALMALKSKAKANWSAWYSPKNPDHSALEKAFPSGLLFRTVVCYGVLIYFFFIRIFRN